MKIKSFLVLVLSLVSSAAFAAGECSQVQAPKVLSLTYPAAAKMKNPVDVQFQLDGDSLIAQFTVRTPTINAKPVLGPKEYPFQADVVELFLSVSGNSAENIPYYEFELSPYGNTYQVRIDSLKKPFVGGIDMGIQQEVMHSPEGWKGRMTIPLKALGWNGDPSLLRGNAYSILGKAPNRTYWSTFLPKLAKPNFHKPEFFKPLLECQ